MDSNQIIQILNGISYGLLLFMMAAGLSLVFGLMGVINMSHGSWYMIGAYTGITVMRLTGSFILAALSGGAAAALLGMAMERFFLNKLYRRTLEQVLLTFGFSYIFMDLCKWLWGRAPFSGVKPAVLEGSLQIGDASFPIYRIAIILIGLAVALALRIFLEKTRTGMIIRAGVDDKEMVSALGINIRRYFLLVFSLGAFLSGFGGVVGAPVTGVYPGVDSDILLLSLAVVVTGGLGTLKGAFWGSMLIGVSETMGKIFIPGYSIVTTYVIMAILLLFKPAGLFGKGEIK